MDNILAIIPFYKRSDQLEQCLAALAASTHPAEAFVVDNNTENKGFTKACNLGLRESMRRGHTYAILLNQDCYVSQDAIEKAVSFMRSHPRCAVAGLKQLSAEDPDLIVHGGCAEAFPVGQHITGRASRNDCAVSRPMPWVNGACMVVRVDALYETGLMDEGFFLIASDADFCFVARQRGWEVWYCAESVVFHEGGGVSSKQPTLNLVAYFNADQLHFRDKWVGSMGWECLQKAPPVPGDKLAEEKVRGLLETAFRHFQKSELREAELIVRRILDFEPENSTALLILARIYIDLGAPAAAARILLAAIKASPNCAQTHLALGDALFFCQASEQSAFHYQCARSFGIQSPEMSMNLATVFLQQGKREQAIGEWRVVLKMDPAHAEARHNLRESGFAEADV